LAWRFAQPPLWIYGSIQFGADASGPSCLSGSRASHAKAPANHHGDAGPSLLPFFVFFVLFVV
jgi:hypothetical protein